MEHNVRGGKNSQEKWKELLTEEEYKKKMSDMGKKGWNDERRERVREAMKKKSA